MADRVASHLKVYNDAAVLSTGRELADGPAEIDTICATLSDATGWPIRYVAGPAPSQDPLLQWSAPVNLGVGTTPGHLRMDRHGAASGERRRGRIDETRRLMDLVAGLVNQRTALRQALGEREADLAAGIPVRQHAGGAAHLAERLSAVLRGGAESLGCCAAAMYLLDDATTELKLRAEWGLGESRLLDPARPLRGAVGDLEALSGHAVVLEDDSLWDLWRVPEPCGAAICVPLSGPTTIIGTLWLFAAAPRTFTSTETNLAEIVAGRLVAELDREVLLNQAELGNFPSDRNQMNEAALDQVLPNPTPTASPILLAAVPRVAPQVKDWDVAARILGAADPTRSGLVLPSGAFVQWHLDENGILRAIVGQAGDGLAGQFAAAGLRGAWQFGAARQESPSALLDALAQQVWSTTSGETLASVAALQLLPAGQVQISIAGQVSAFICEPGSGAATTVTRLLHHRAEPLGALPLVNEAVGNESAQRHGTTGAPISAGQWLVVAAGLPSNCDKSRTDQSPGSLRKPFDVAAMASTLAGCQGATAALLCEKLGQRYAGHFGAESAILLPPQVAMLVARHRNQVGPGTPRDLTGMKPGP